MHRLLLRQLRRLDLDHQDLPETTQQLLRSISEAYDQADDDRRLLERSLELTSTELMQRNRELRADVEARSRAEHALRERDAQTQAILSALPDLLLVVSAQGRIEQIHAPGPSFLPRPAAELVGQSLEQALPQQLYGPLVSALARVAGDGQSQRLELGLQSGDKTMRYEARLTVSAMGDMVVVMRDQTERMHMAERLRVADRMASVGTLAAGVAHELNNPLAYVLGNLELLRQHLRQSAGHGAELSTLANEAHDGARRMKAITQDLRTFSQPHADAIESIDPRSVVESSLRMAATEIRHRATLRRHYEPVPPVFAELGKLGQVFLNLIVNAVQALPVGEVTEHEIVARTDTSGEGWAVIEISDTGPGIPSSLLSRIFEPFVTSKPRGVGTGLGLSICHNIVTSLGGRITVHPRPNRGTTFRVTLPPSGAPVAATRRTTSSLPAVPAVPPSARRVLVIDDDTLVASALRRLLASRSEVVVTGSGREGLERLRGPERFDVVLCDLMMPELSGMDVYETVEQERPDLAGRFVFMTGGAFTERARAFLERVTNPRLEKPFDSAELRALVWDRADQ